MEYAIDIFDLVNNHNDYQFYKLSIDGVCLFDEFLKEIESISQDKKNFAKILFLMDNFSAKPYPKQKFNHIVANKNERTDIYEFKSDSLRVYVILQKPNIYIVRGGWKKNQQRDIDKVKNDTKEFNPNDIQL